MWPGFEMETLAGFLWYDWKAQWGWLWQHPKKLVVEANSYRWSITDRNSKQISKQKRKSLFFSFFIFHFPL